MVDDKLDASKIDPEDIIDAEYDGIPDEHRQTFKAQIKHEQEEATMRLLSCFKRTRQGVVLKEEFIMPMFPLSNSSTARSTSKTRNVSIDPINFINHFVDALGKRFDESQKSTRDLAIRINNQLQALSKGKNVDYSYSTSTLNPSSAATPTSISLSLHSMPPNYFAGQSPPPRSALPIMAEPVRPVQPTSQTGVTVVSPATLAPFASISCLAGPSRTYELANIDSSYTNVACNVPPIFPRGSGVHHGPIPDDVHND